MDENLSELYEALQNADAAGDTEAAKQLAEYIQNYQAGSEPSPTSLDDAKKALEKIQPTAPPSVDQLPEGNPLTGALGTAIGMGQNLGAGLAGQIAALPTALRNIGGSTEPAERKAAEVAQKYAREPTTQTEREYTEKIGSALGALPPVIGEGFGLATPAAKQASGIIGDTAKNLSTKVIKPVSLTPEQLLKNEVAKQSIESGYVIPPSQAVSPSLTGKSAEALSGKIQTAQKFSEHNQANTAKLVKEDLGIPQDIAITPEVLKGLRKQAGVHYEALKNVPINFKATPKFRTDVNAIAQRLFEGKDELPGLFSTNSQAIQGLFETLNNKEFSPASTVAAIKKLKEDSKVNLRAIDNGEKLELGRAQGMAADALEDLVDQNLSSSVNRLKMHKAFREAGINNVNPTTLLKDFRNARRQIAKTYSVENALGPNGSVYASKLGSDLGKGKPLTGKLKTAAEFARSYPKAIQNVEKIGSQPGWSPLDIYGSATGAGAGAYLGSHLGPAGAAVGALMGASAPIVRPWVRNLMMRPGFQKNIPVRDVVLPPKQTALRGALEKLGGSTPELLGGALSRVGGPGTGLISRSIPPALLPQEAARILQAEED